MSDILGRVLRYPADILYREDFALWRKRKFVLESPLFVTSLTDTEIRRMTLKLAFEGDAFADQMCHLLANWYDLDSKHMRNSIMMRRAFCGPRSQPRCDFGYSLTADEVREAAISVINSNSNRMAIVSAIKRNNPRLKAKKGEFLTEHTRYTPHIYESGLLYD